MSNSNKIIHTSLELERAVLGHVLHNKSMSGVYGFLNHKDFSDKRNETLFLALSKISQGFGENEIEIGVLINFLKENEELESIGGESYIAQLIEEAALPSNIPKFIKKIEEKSRLRKFASDINEIQKKLNDPQITSEQLLDTVENQVLSSIRDVEIKGFENSKIISDRAYSILEKKAIGQTPSGIKSDLIELDKWTGGFQKGDLIILAARPSMGKTALALNFINSIAKRGETVAFFSIEMPAEQIFNRLFAIEGMLDISKLRDPSNFTEKDWTKLQIAKEKISKYKLFVDDTPGIKLMDLVWKAKSLHKNSPLSLLVIDYLQLITLGENSITENRQNEVSTISRTLKKLARELNIPIIALSQLSRKVEMRESKVPMMSDLRESGAIEQDADLITFIYRDDYYKSAEEKAKSEEINNGVQKTQVIIGKHRNGATGDLFLSFTPKNGLFYDRQLKRENI